MVASHEKDNSWDVLSPKGLVKSSVGGRMMSSTGGKKEFLDKGKKELSDTAGPLAKQRAQRMERRLGKKTRSKKFAAKALGELTDEFVPQAFPKSEEDRELIQAELRQSFVFQKCSPRSLEQLTQAFELTSIYNLGDVILQQGDLDPKGYFYIIQSGSVDYEVDGVKVQASATGSSFGENALLYDSPRTATVRASSTTRLFRVDQITFRYVLQSQVKFGALWKRASLKVTAANRIIKMTALKNSKRKSVDSALIILQKEIESLEDGVFEMKRDQSKLGGQELSLDSFERLAVLGEGQFGKVWKVTANFDLEEQSGKRYALKIQSKKDILAMHAPDSGSKDATLNLLYRECEVLSRLNHVFIVDLVYYFEDDNDLCMVMGIVSGQELWNVIHTEDQNGDWHSGIPEAAAKFYGLLIAEALNFMHTKKICYRDLKPENVMIDETGYPVIVDFGFAKFLPNDQTFTFCGTPKYSCPEIICNEGHGYAVDHWALGVVIYEMLSGESPFYYDGIDDIQLLDDIVNAAPFPLADDASSASSEAKDIVQKLLVKHPKERLGSLQGLGQDILDHPFFDGIDLVKALEKSIPAPSLPWTAVNDR